MKNPIVIMNFSGVYEKEIFYKEEEFEWLDCKNVRGTNCYCDEAAGQELKKMIQDYPPDGIHFIDSGNYHYVTKLWTDKIKEPFSLVLFDHHADMQPPAFGDVLSCGSWVKELLDTYSNLKKVYLMGIGEEFIFPVKNKYKDKVVWFSEKDLKSKKALSWFKNAYIKESLYVSVDKDLLSPETVTTNWDQGEVSLDTLLELIHIILVYQKVIGMDVTGECGGISAEEKKPKLFKAHNLVNNVLLQEYLKTQNIDKLNYNIKEKVRR